MLKLYIDVRVEIEMASSLANNMVTYDVIIYNTTKEFESKKYSGKKQFMKMQRKTKC